MSEWSRDLAKRFGEIEGDRRVRNQIKLQDAGRLIHEGPILFEELSSRLDEKAAELNQEPEMRGVKILVDRNVVANQTRLRRMNPSRDAQVFYDPNLHVIRFGKAKYQMAVREGEHNVTIFDSACRPAALEELAGEILAAFLDV